MKQIFNKYDDNITSCQYESYLPQHVTELNKYNRNTTIIMNGTDKFLNLRSAKLYIKFNCLQEDGTKYPSLSNIQLNNNAGANLFQRMVVKLGKKVIDESDFVGIASTVKGFVSYATIGNGPNENSGFESTNQGGGEADLMIPLSCLALGFFKETGLIYNPILEITFTRNNDDNALFLTENSSGTTETKAIKAKRGKIEITELKILCQTVEYDETTKVNIVNELLKLSQAKHYRLGFKKWQCLEERNISKNNLRINVSNNYKDNDPPKFIFVQFQTNRLDNQSSDASRFDNCNVKNYWVEINGKRYPNEMQNIDFNNLTYAQAYEDLMEYKKTYYKSNEDQPLMYVYKTDFRNKKTVLAINTSRHPSQIATSNCKVIVNVDFHENLPDKTICYICLVSNAEFMYDIERGTIEEII